MTWRGILGMYHSYSTTPRRNPEELQHHVSAIFSHLQRSVRHRKPQHWPVLLYM